MLRNAVNSTKVVSGYTLHHLLLRSVGQVMMLSGKWTLEPLARQDRNIQDHSHFRCHYRTSDSLVHCVCEY